jgi:hypothetical protein
VAYGIHGPVLGDRRQRTARQRTDADERVGHPRRRLYVATDGTQIYWANVPAAEMGSVVGCEIANCKPTTLILAQASSYDPVALLVDDVAIYWSDNGPNATIWKLAK